MNFKIKNKKSQILILTLLVISYFDNYFDRQRLFDSIFILEVRLTSNITQLKDHVTDWYWEEGRLINNTDQLMKEVSFFLSGYNTMSYIDPDHPDYSERKHYLYKDTKKIISDLFLQRREYQSANLIDSRFIILLGIYLWLYFRQKNDRN